jgi:5'-nucleotidase
MKKILLTNDDGYFSPGIQQLKNLLDKTYEVYLVAPDSERSAISMALTLNQPLRLAEIAANVFAVNGTPADCINLGVQKIVPGKPDFIVSGMNYGENLAEDIYFSGTVGGAYAGFLYEIPSLAVSLISKGFNHHYSTFDTNKGAEIALEIIDQLIKIEDLIRVYNVNIPFQTNGKILLTTLGSKRYRPDIIEKKDPRGRDYYWIGTGNPSYIGSEGTDIWAVTHGFVSLSVLNYQMQFQADEFERIRGVLDGIKIQS